MKRNCPNCKARTLNRKLLTQYLNCTKCDKIFVDSIILRVASGLNMLLLLASSSMLNIVDFEFYLAAMFIINIFLIFQYLPVTPVEQIELNILPPTDVEFEKTNDVNENIRRYKKAQQLAIKNYIAKLRSR